MKKALLSISGAIVALYFTVFAYQLTRFSLKENSILYWPFILLGPGMFVVLATIFLAIGLLAIFKEPLLSKILSGKKTRKLLQTIIIGINCIEFSFPLIRFTAYPTTEEAGLVSAMLYAMAFGITFIFTIFIMDEFDFLPN